MPAHASNILETDTKKKRRKKKKPGERQTKPTAHAKRLKEALEQLAAEKVLNVYLAIY